MRIHNASIGFAKATAKMLLGGEARELPAVATGDAEAVLCLQAAVMHTP